MAGTLLWKDILRGFNNSTPGQAGRREVVRYDSPAFAGFTLTAAWGADGRLTAWIPNQGAQGLRYMQNPLTQRATGSDRCGAACGAGRCGA